MKGLIRLESVLRSFNASVPQPLGLLDVLHVTTVLIQLIQYMTLQQTGNGQEQVL